MTGFHRIESLEIPSSCPKILVRTMISRTGRPVSDEVDLDRKTRRWVKALVLVGLLEFPFLTWLWLAPLAQPKPFTNHTDQVTDALLAQGITVKQLYISQGWPDRINHQTYGANLIIYTANASDSAPIPGRIECRVAKRKCWFQVAKLGIARVELADLAPTTPAAKPDPTWQDRLRNILARLGFNL
jgi:hypothetical protein